jgi:group II intron reverse transcriptase/maturase
MTITKLERIAWLSARDRHKRFDNVMHLFTEENLAECYRSLDGRKAVGADGVTKKMYGENLEGNLKDLVERMRRMAYRPGASREVLIPKPGQAGRTRPLGISNLEDKIVQGMMYKVLAAIYEPLFLDCSYGFRPGRSAHDAVRDLHRHLYSHRVSTVIDVDLSRYFDSIDQQLLLEMIDKKVGDRRFLRYLCRQFKAGVLRDGELSIRDDGVVQGSLCSPILANIFAHAVIDEWFEDIVKRHCRGEVVLFRYADDVVICCEHEHDADRVLKALRQRLERFGLRLNDEKTRTVSFARPSAGRNGGTWLPDPEGQDERQALARVARTCPGMGEHCPYPARAARDLEHVLRQDTRPPSLLWGVVQSPSAGHVHHSSHPHHVQMAEPPKSTPVL